MKRKLISTYIYLSLWLLFTLVPAAWAASTKLSALTELATAPAASDEMYINDGGVSKKIQVSNLVTYPRTPGTITLPEGETIIGNTSNVGTGTAFVPNLVMTVNLEDADCDGLDDPFDCCTGAGTGSCDDIMSMTRGIHGIAGGSTDLDQWDIAYVKAADSELYDADGDLADSWPGIGLATTDAADGVELVILQAGCVRNDAWNWSTLGPEGNIYLSDDPTTTNGLTQTPLSTAGDCHQKVGWAYSDDVACFDFGAYGVVK
jgi:hypothetical protein